FDGVQHFHQKGEPLDFQEELSDQIETTSPQGIEEEYLSDDKIRIHGPNLPHEGASGLDGIKAIQKTLLEATDAVRLIGLSGVGKTRLAQALFDHRLSDSPLASHHVCYTDTSYSPSPSPLALAERLVTIGGTAILIVDNCAPDLHTQLTNICQLKTSKVKLITIEYDIKEDQAESTNVFRLEPSSDTLIAKLIETRFKAVGYANAHTIADFAGGNARVAMSLATTVRKGESLSILKDSELFDRLFRQRNQPDPQFKEVAEICSLVYSFNAGEGDENEIATLCSLTDMSERTFYKKVSELLRRDLAQQRGNWRAILPHAIANRLAGLALDNSRQTELTACFKQAGNERLLSSFAKRIGLLHDHPKAVAIAQEWLSPFGLVGNVPDLNDSRRAIFFNLAPAAPEAALQALEEAETHERASTFFSRENLYFTEIVNLLCSIAYEPALFSKSIRLLTRFALTERIDENNNSIRRRIRQLFSLILSGTQATAQDRYGEIDHLLKSGDIDKERIGLQWLDASLKTRNFSLDSLPKFGARTREVYSVSISKDEYREWYRLFINTMILLHICGEQVKPLFDMPDCFRILPETS
ncbi:hypothetical protein, partial [Desulfovibrio psychrotolerans]|uniref:hypothetical protein n=1 Tax=Desulfovibrio psychrotolerans TaxID=415242 RepID=UPI001964BA0A